MITHYLKVALRNLLKYKAHSFISAICLAIGITCFCLTNYFIDIVTAQTDLPDYERRISLACCSEDTAADIYWKLDDIRYLDEQSITGMDSLVTASFPRNTEITVIDKNQQELPFIIKYQCVSSSFFPYKVIRPVSGKGKLDAPDEVIISQEFAHKAFGKEDPTGMIIHLVPTYKEYPEQIKDYKIVGVVTDQDLDCYFPLSMDPYASFSVGTFLMGETTLENLNKQLKQTTWQRGELNVYAYASLNAARNDDLQRNITMLLFRFVGSLILLSGLINFLKFIIQMFYNRQRELALRKCLGSNIKGLFSLLFAEIFWINHNRGCSIFGICLYTPRRHDFPAYAKDIRHATGTVHGVAVGMYVRHTVPHSPVATIEHHSLYRAKTGTARVSQHHDKCTIGYLHFLCRGRIRNHTHL